MAWSRDPCGARTPEAMIGSGNRRRRETIVAKPKWKDLPRQRRGAIIALASVELALTAAAAADLVRRPADLVRGPKPLWWLAIFVQPVGPVAYLAWGRNASAR